MYGDIFSYSPRKKAKSSSPPHHPLGAQHLEGKTIIFGRDLRRLFTVTHQVNLEGKGRQQHRFWPIDWTWLEKHLSLCQGTRTSFSRKYAWYQPTTRANTHTMLTCYNTRVSQKKTRCKHSMKSFPSCYRRTMATQLFAQMAAKLPTSGVGKPSKLTTSKQVPSNVLTALTSLSLTVPWWQNWYRTVSLATSRATMFFVANRVNATV